MVFVVALIIAAGLGLIPANIAKKKGYSFGLWWFYGWMLFIVAIIHVALIEDKNPKPVVYYAPPVGAPVNTQTGGAAASCTPRPTAENYTRLFSLPEKLYQSGAPVCIVEGALLKDEQSGCVLSQLKLQSLSDKTIRAVKASVSLMDAFGKAMNVSAEHQYLDLSIMRGQTFGADTKVTLPDANARAFCAAVTAVMFTDGTLWEAPDAPWEAMAAPVSLEEVYPDAELQWQFKLEFGTKSRYAYSEFADLCYCPCGALNRQSEAKCHACGCDLTALRTLDVAGLETRKDERLEQARLEKEERLEQLRLAEEERKERERLAEEKRQEQIRLAKEKAAADMALTKKVAKITASIMVVVIAFLIVLNSVIIPNGKYNDALALMEAEQYEEAIDAFEALDGYRDSAEKITEYEIAEIKTTEVGDSVYFGSYEQDNDEFNGEERIEWIVLDVQDGKALLISRYALDCRPYNEERTSVTWETCTLRKWLNDEFLNTAFSSAEQALIPTVTVSADKNPNYDTNPGKATQDKVFLLSVLEVEKYFASDDVMICSPTESVKAKGVTVRDINYVDDSEEVIATGEACAWWLRSPVSSDEGAAFVLVGVDYDGVSVGASDAAVRPAIWVEIGE